jgi:hypothetical protein
MRTDVAFLCDETGTVYGVQALATNAVFNQPFALSNAAIQLTGNAFLADHRDDMSADDRRQIQRLVDDADAKGILRWSLRFEMMRPPAKLLALVPPPLQRIAAAETPAPPETPTAVPGPSATPVNP